MVSVSRYDACAGLPLIPTRTASSCSEGSFNIPRSDARLNKAFSRVALHDEVASQIQPDTQPSQDQQVSGQRRSSDRRLLLDISSLPASQEYHTQGTQGFSTPVEQQFLLDPESSALMDEDSRSPAPSPKKRHRPTNPIDADSDGMSQDGLSQSRSQGEPSSCSKATAAGPRCRPPAGPKSKKRQEPTRFSQQQLSRLSRDYIVDNKEIGHGHYSTVYKAIHRQCGKAYAIKKSKRPLHSTNDLNSWLEEVKVLATVEGHPNIVTYHDSWAEPSIVGEYQHIKLELCGESLGVHVKTKQALPNNELWDIVRQMASALRHIHSLGLAHLDVKPDNILRSESGAFKLGDFGHATLLDGSKGWTEGDARYMAAEMLKSQPASVSLEKVDIFALGATLYELASGIPLPTSGDRWNAIREGKQAMMLPAVTHQLQTLIKKMMSPDPAARPDAAAVLAVCDRQMGPLPLRPSQPIPNNRRSL